MFGMTPSQSPQAGNNYLQMMMNFLRQMQQAQAGGQNQPAPIAPQQNMLGNSAMTGQAMGKPMANTAGQGGGGIWSTFHNVMQNNGNLARGIPAHQSTNTAPSAAAPSPNSILPGDARPTTPAAQQFDPNAALMSSYNRLAAGKTGGGNGIQNNANWGEQNVMPDFNTWRQGIRR